MKCVIVASMEEQDIVIPEDSFVIAADRGYEQLVKRGIQPDLIVGDFDSLEYVPQEKNVLVHPVEKDDTDMLLAVREGLARGCDSFILYGGLGGRLDHTMANVQTLTFLAEQGARGYLYGDGTVLTVLKNGSIQFPEGLSGTISVFSLSDVSDGVTEKGLYYSLEHGSMTNSFPIGVSNSFLGIPSEILVEDGTLLIMWHSDVRTICQML